MNEVKKIMPFAKGFKVIYLLGMLAVVVSQFFNTLGPLIIGISVDSILGDKPISSKYFSQAIEFLGGRETIIDSLWIIGAVIIINTALTA